MTAQEELITAAEFSQIQFDFLIIGGGTAGLAVAARLSEHSQFKVGVLEAGPLVRRQDTVDIPGLYGQTIGTEHDWGFETVPQQGLHGRVLPWPRGKLVGGTSALNFMIWNRGSKEDYNAWEQLGNPGWGWDNLLPFFKKSETIHRPTLSLQTDYGATFDPEVSGTTGPISVSYPNYYPATHQLWRQALNSLGVESNKAHLSGSNTGVWTCVNSITPEEQTRSYATSSYYTPNVHRKNLFLVTGAFVNEITLESTDDGVHKATGVTFTCNGQQHHVSAKYEVILSAGTVQSPQILELSGIGNPKILANAGKVTKVDNPSVGENLQEHIMAAIVFETKAEVQNDPDIGNKEPDAALEEYRRQRTGPLTAVPSCFCYLPFVEALPKGKFEDLSRLAYGLSGSDIQSHAIASERFDTKQRFGQIEYILDFGNWNPAFTPSQDDARNYATVFQILQYPFSKGSIHINPSPDDASVNDPIIDPKYYSGPHGVIDLEAMVHSIHFADEIARSKPLSNLLGPRVFPPTSITADDGYRDWVGKTTITDWHPVGTCSMGGSRGIEGGVVDHRLRVYGVQRLRVIDASIMPLHISAHIQATVYAIAEKGAHMILQDHGVLE